MPFDGTPRVDSRALTIVALLDEAYARLDGGRLWCQRHYTQHVKRTGVVHYCAVGALFKGGRRPFGELDELAYQALKVAALELGYRNPEELNDRAGFVSVTAMYARAMEIANAV